MKPRVDSSKGGNNAVHCLVSAVSEDVIFFFCTAKLLFSIMVSFCSLFRTVVTT